VTKNKERIALKTEKLKKRIKKRINFRKRKLLLQMWCHLPNAHGTHQ
jgi:hypothetical protein